MSLATGDRPGGLRKIRSTYQRYRYAILFYTLLLTMVAAPLFAAFEFAGALIDFFLAANLLAAVVPASMRKGRRILLVMVVAVSLARPVTAWLNYPALSAMTLALWTLVGLFAAAGAVRFAKRAKLVDTEHLFAALSAYLLAGVFFGLAYWVIEQIGPGSFAAPGEFSRISALYFSFVTLATLGYGDIAPRSDLARGLALVGAVGGQLFLVVLVARLVSLWGRKDGGV
jgi:voltage-gated potassium channel